MWKHGRFHRSTTNFLRLKEYVILGEGALLENFGSTSSAIKSVFKGNWVCQDQLKTAPGWELNVITCNKLRKDGAPGTLARLIVPFLKSVQYTSRSFHHTAIAPTEPWLKAIVP